MKVFVILALVTLALQGSSRGSPPSDLESTGNSPGAATGSENAGGLKIEGYAESARGGFEKPIVMVTTLADSGPGSLREALGSDRHVKFSVDGTIEIDTSLKVEGSNLTIDARGRSVTIQNRKNSSHTLMYRNCKNVVTTNLRILGASANQRDAVSIEGCQLMAFDQMTMRWGTDECLGIKDSSEVTVQWSMIVECLLPHSKGALIREGTNKVNFHHTLFANNLHRNPQFGIADDAGADFDVRNCVLYDAGTTGLRGVTEFKKNGNVNYINNKYVKGPDASHDFVVTAPAGGNIFESGNVGDFTHFVHPHHAEQVVEGPAAVPAITTGEAESAATAVLDRAGALPRDAADRRIITEVRSKSGRIKETVTH